MNWIELNFYFFSDVVFYISFAFFVYNDCNTNLGALITEKWLNSETHWFVYRDSEFTMFVLQELLIFLDQLMKHLLIIWICWKVFDNIHCNTFRFYLLTSLGAMAKVFIKHLLATRSHCLSVQSRLYEELKALHFCSIVGSFRVSLFIDLGCP